MADGQAEGQEYPDLLTLGYFDKDNIVDLAFNSTKFLFLGYKGSGKTALSEHLRLMKKEGIIIDQVQLSSFPYKNFSKIVTGDDEAEVKIKAAWQWLLQIKILNSLIDDPDAKTPLQSDLRKTIDLFTQLGIFPVTDISSLVKKTSSNSFKASIKSLSFEHSIQRENTSVSFEMALDYILKIILSFKEEKEHILIIDGLDDILTSKEMQYKSIAGLLNVVKDLNAKFSQNGLTAKTIILCRTDIFERLPDPNKNKIRSDFSYTFNWYIEGLDDQQHCGLIDIANIRTQLVYPKINDMFNTFFPRKYEGKEVKQYLLDMTRHTPRDFLRLLTYIQKQSKAYVDEEAIKKGINEYSSEYFIPEIKDEMTGYIPYDLIDSIINLLSSFRQREISYKDFCDQFDSHKEFKDREIDADSILGILYDCSAIGNTYTYNDGKSNRFTFKYRNRTSSFNRMNTIILHRGLWKGLNINF